MFTILKNVKYLLFLLLFTSIKAEANNEKLALHGGYTFETDQEQRAIHEANMGTLDENLTPVVDMDRLSTILTRMEFSNNTENELLPKAPTDYNTPISRYIGLVVDTGYEANIVRVSFHATRREGTGFRGHRRAP